MFHFVYVLFSGSSTGLAVGLTVGLLFLLLIIGIPICIVVIICCYKINRRSQRPPQTRVATTPATGPTVVTSNQTSMTNLNLYKQPQYPQGLQQPVHKDAQSHSQEPLPSYSAATAAANPTQQIPLVIYVHYFYIGSI